MSDPSPRHYGDTIPMFPELEPETNIPPATPEVKAISLVDERIWRYIRDVGTATSDDVSYALDMDGRSTAHARIRELVKKGRLRETGDRKPTRTGRTARVYEAISPREAGL